VALDYAFTDRQADAATRVLVAGVQALEDAEYAPGVTRVDPDAVVGHGESPTVVVALGLHVHARRSLAAELDPVADQVLEQLAQLAGISTHRRQVAHDDHRAGVRDRRLHAAKRVPDQLLAIHRADAVFGRADARVGEQVVDQPLHAVHPVHREADELVRVRVQLTPVAA
jgi:hypothetical protein